MTSPLCKVAGCIGAAIALAGSLLVFLADPAVAANESSTLLAGQSLSSGQALWSTNGSYEAIMQSDGNFVEYGPSGYVWATFTGVRGSHISMQTDGNLVVYSPSGAPLWSSSTAPSSNDSLVMQTDSNLVVYSHGGLPLWSSLGGRTGYSAYQLSAGQSLSSGQALWSTNGSYEAIMQSDGNFVEYGPSGYVWATFTGVRGSHISMQTDGNLVVYSPSGAALWDTATFGAGGSLVLQSDSNSVVYFAGTALWASGRSHGRTVASDPNAGSDAGNCTYWAGYEWYLATGSWPEITGNAYQWAATASAAGFSVTPAPESRSIVVFPRGPGAASLGHVAWVTSVTYKSNGSISVGISEMNYKGLGVVDQRTITNTSGLLYILAPY